MLNVTQYIFISIIHDSLFKFEKLRGNWVVSNWISYLNKENINIFHHLGYFWNLIEPNFMHNFLFSVDHLHKTQYILFQTAIKYNTFNFITKIFQAPTAPNNNFFINYHTAQNKIQFPEKLI